MYAGSGPVYLDIELLNFSRAAGGRAQSLLTLRNVPRTGGMNEDGIVSNDDIPARRIRHGVSKSPPGGNFN